MDAPFRQPRFTHQQEHNLRNYHGPRVETDSYSGEKVVRRINSQTGNEEELIQGAIGPYWQDASRVLRDEWGNVIDVDEG